MEKIDLEKYHKVKCLGIKMEIPLVITVKCDNIVDLPGEKYDPKADYSPKFEVEDDVREWLKENVTGKFFADISNLYFEKSEDAVAFKLRWS